MVAFWLSLIFGVTRIVISRWLFLYAGASRLFPWMPGLRGLVGLEPRSCWQEVIVGPDRYCDRGNLRLLRPVYRAPRAVSLCGLQFGVILVIQDLL